MQPPGKRLTVYGQYLYCQRHAACHRRETPPKCGSPFPGCPATSSGACTRCRRRISPRNAAAISRPSSTRRSSRSARIPASTPRGCREIIYFDRSTIGDVLDRMEGKGWILRQSTPSDRRIKRLELSPAGQEVLQQVEPGIRRVQERLLAAADRCRGEDAGPAAGENGRRRRGRRETGFGDRD